MRLLNKSEIYRILQLLGRPPGRVSPALASELLPVSKARLVEARRLGDTEAASELSQARQFLKARASKVRQRCPGTLCGGVIIARGNRFCLMCSRERKKVKQIA